MRIAVVAGASSGIGRSIAVELCKNYADTFDELWLIARRLPGLRETAELCGTDRIKLVEADIRDRESLEKAACVADSDCVSWLVVSAGTGFYGDFKDSDGKLAEDVIDLNCRANASVISAFLPHCRKGTKIINIASAAAFSPQPGFAVYAASKAFVYSFSRALSKELKKDGISVTAVCPGPCDTDFLNRARDGRALPAYKQKSVTTPEIVARKALKTARKGKSVCIPTFSMKLAYAAGKILPANLVMNFLYKGNKK
ncbi:MAG: SDR family NAD(P)-dependent oxidoreductase [Clostridia bacterium]|nr:SDR family NAD(P)-dependent oxidoreductase [Clostridia bacterium]